ncbi:FAD dependent oxidoreductase [Lasallia pustulata]|uniref:FAD dependent oxidoreductase n=1 Tax=Lasallia pustulata TaxID=136370 RepID=A0A1W5D649_9LECA|nr:FAD dependent oxidoreductase [Lasallia pustulata]
MSTVILGAGIIGTSTAYYLSQSTHTPPAAIHLVESSPRLFASASGYAAGFLAKDWFSSSVAPLGALSFDLHQQLAEEYNGREAWGYSRSTGTSLADTGGKCGDDWLRDGNSRAETAGQHGFVSGDGPAWLTSRGGGRFEVISEGDSTAQVDPLRLCHFLLKECLARGVHLHQPAMVISVSTDMRDTLASVRIASTSDGTETDIPCTRLIIAAGAWSRQVFSNLFPQAQLKLPISSLAGHSLVVRSPRWQYSHEEQGCHAVFTTDAAGYSPEVFSRIGGEIYIAGLNSNNIPLPELATESQIDEESIGILKTTATRLLGVPGKEDDLEIVRTGLCFRPVTNRGTPILGRVPENMLGGDVSPRDGGGVWIGAGHGPWGISLSLGTGKCLAEMVEGGKTSADVRGLGLG